MGRVGNGGTDAARSDFRASSYPAVPISTPLSAIWRPESPKGCQTGIALCGVSKGRGEAFTSDGAEAVDTSDRIPDLEFDF